MRKAPTVYKDRYDDPGEIDLNFFIRIYFERQGLEQAIDLLYEKLEDEEIENEAIKILKAKMSASNEGLKRSVGSDPELTFQWWLEQEYYRCVSVGPREEEIDADDEDDPRWAVEMREYALRLEWWPEELVKTAPDFVLGQESWH